MIFASILMKCPDCGEKLKVCVGGNGRYEGKDYDLKLMYCPKCKQQFYSEHKITGKYICEIFQPKY